MDLCPQYFNHDEESYKLIRPSLNDYAYEDRKNHPEAIAPWDFLQQPRNNLYRLNHMADVRKNYSQIVTSKNSQSVDIHNFLEKSGNREKNKSDLAKLKKKSENSTQNKNNRFHLNMSKIQFTPYEGDPHRFILNSQSFKLKMAQDSHKISPQTIPTQQHHNFVIKDYFLPNSQKTSKRKQIQTEESKRTSDYKLIKQIKTPSFIAIKSVDLKEKIQFDNKFSDDQDQIQQAKNSPNRYLKFRTLQTRIKRRQKRGAGCQSTIENYPMYCSLQKSKKMMEETKQSQYQGSLFELRRNNANKATISMDSNNAGKTSTNSQIPNIPIVIATTSSFIKRSSHQTKRFSEVINQKGLSQENQQDKIFSRSIPKPTLTKEKVLIVQRLKRLKSKNQLQFFLDDMNPQFELQKNNQQQQRNILLQSKSPQNQQAKKLQQSSKVEKAVTFSTRLRKKIHTNNLNKTLVIFNCLQQK